MKLNAYETVRSYAQPRNIKIKTLKYFYGFSRHLQTTSGLAKHYKKAHINQDLLCCNFCGNCYKDEKELAHHVFEKHENNGNSTGTDSELEMMTAGSQGKLFLSFWEFRFKF